MWRPETVERGLFQWHGWRQSIVAQWAGHRNRAGELSLEQVKANARQELRKLNFPGSLWLELYYVCCINSDYNLDDDVAHKNIVISDWLPMPFDPLLWDYQIFTGTRIYPPAILSERELDFITEVDLEGVNQAYHYPREHEPRIFLPSHHELYSVLGKLRARTKRFTKVGRRPLYSDHLAVRCAALRKSGMTHVQIAENLGLPVKSYYFSRQSYVTQHLVNRGEKLLQAVGLSKLSTA